MQISCVIVNYNDYKRTIKLVDRIKEYSLISHIIVVDNCSSDNSYNELTKYIHGKYVLIKSEKNGGYGYGNNVGIRKSKEYNDDIVVIANPDIFFSNKCLESMVNLLISEEKCAVVGARENYIGVNGWRYTSGIDDVLSGSLIFNKLLKKRYYSKEHYMNKDKVLVDIVPGCFLMIKLDYMMKYGMYDEEFFLYEEEKVLYKKFSDVGLYSIIDLSVSFEHHHINSTDTSVRKLIETKKRLIDSKSLFLSKYRHFSKIQMLLSKCFFALTIIEMAVYGLYRKIARGLR